MKQKKFNKKLSLSKKTIADLDNFAEKQIHGGDAAATTAPCSHITKCDLYTNCYRVSLCWTECGGPAC